MRAFYSHGNITPLAGYLLATISAALFVVFYVNTEHPAYLWDWGGYWRMYQGVGGLPLKDMVGQLQNSVATDDYNSSSIIPLLPVYWLFGGGRLPYVVSIVVLYLVPAAMIAFAFAITCGSVNRRRYMLAAAAALIFPVFWNASLRGLPDVVGLIPLGIAAILLIRTDYLTRAPWLAAAAFGLLVWSPFLFRRWYTFSLIALVGLAVIAAMLLCIKGTVPVRRIPAVLARFALAGVVAAAGAVTFQFPLLERIVTTSYSDIYSAYQTDLAGQIQNYYSVFGVFTPTLVLVGLARDLWSRRTASLFAVAVALMTAILLARVQQPSVQHILPVGLFLFPAYASGIVLLFDHAVLPLRVLLVALIGFNFVNDVAPFNLGLSEATRSLFAAQRFPPLHLDNYPEYRRLIADLTALPSDAKVSVFASSISLSDALLQALEPELSGRVVAASQVDLRDRFSWNTLASDYVVIGTPTPLHLQPTGQRVIAIPADQIRSGQGIGAAYSDIGRSYDLQGGIEARIYKRNRPLTRGELTDLANTFYGFYPDWRGPDATDMRLFALLVPGGPTPRITAVDSNMLQLDAAGGAPIAVAFDRSVTGQAKHISARLDPVDWTKCTPQSAVLLGVGGGSKAVDQVELKPGQTQSLQLPEGGPVTVNARALDASTCDRIRLWFDKD